MYCRLDCLLQNPILCEVQSSMGPLSLAKRREDHPAYCLVCRCVSLVSGGIVFLGAPCWALLCYVENGYVGVSAAVCALIGCDATAGRVTFNVGFNLGRAKESACALLEFHQSGRGHSYMQANWV
jgi:hypothetical protein